MNDVDLDYGLGQRCEGSYFGGGPSKEKFEEEYKKLMERYNYKKGFSPSAVDSIEQLRFAADEAIEEKNTWVNRFLPQKREQEKNRVIADYIARIDAIALQETNRLELEEKARVEKVRQERQRLLELQMKQDAERVRLEEEERKRKEKASKEPLNWFGLRTMPIPKPFQDIEDIKPYLDQYHPYKEGNQKNLLKLIGDHRLQTSKAIGYVNAAENEGDLDFKNNIATITTGTHIGNIIRHPDNKYVFFDSNYVPPTSPASRFYPYRDNIKRRIEKDAVTFSKDPSAVATIELPDQNWGCLQGQMGNCQIWNYLKARFPEKTIEWLENKANSKLDPVKYPKLYKSILDLAVERAANYSVNVNKGWTKETIKQRAEEDPAVERDLVWTSFNNYGRDTVIISMLENAKFGELEEPPPPGLTDEELETLRDKGFGKKKTKTGKKVKST